jgi:protein-L-isoaspartate(D-aspartate) O-methyltransferase
MPHPNHLADTPQHRGQRERLVQELRRKGISNDGVLGAIGRVLRHAFVESALWPQAYQDIALPIAQGQTISQPYTVAYQTELLEPRLGLKVLEIGTGSGYQAAVLCELGVQVFSIERHNTLHRSAKALLTTLGYMPRLKFGDGTVGWAAHAPFDGILVTAASPSVPKAMLEQLAIGGRLVIPVGDRAKQHMTVITRLGDDDFEQTTLDGFQFVPLIGEQGFAK